MTNSKFGKIVSVATSVCLAILGVMFIVCCAHLYYTGGDKPYSAERVGEYLGYILIPSVITIVAIVTGIIINQISGSDTDTKAKLTKQYLLGTLTKKTNINSFDENAKEAVLKERKNRASIKAIFLALSAVCYAICLVYVIFFAKYTVENMTKDIMSAFAIALPFGALGVLMNIPSTILSERSAEREIALIKEAKKNADPIPCEEGQEQNDEDVLGLVAKIIIIALSAIFILLGVLNGGMADVLGKAIKICTECIGLG